MPVHQVLKLLSIILNSVSLKLKWIQGLSQTEPNLNILTEIELN